MKSALGAVLPIFLAVEAQAGVIFADGFDSTVNKSNWQVYQQISDGQWRTTQGTGIEVQTSGTVVDAQSGNQYVELDSSRKRGGAGDGTLTNSAMTRTLTGLEAGDYLLEYYYQPRTNVADDNTIGVYFDGDDLFSTLIDTANGVGANGWLERSVTFSVRESNATRQLSFRGEGIQNSLGGFIDTVSLQHLGSRSAGGGNGAGGNGSVPEPLGLTFIAMALMGMGFGARRPRRVYALPKRP